MTPLLALIGASLLSTHSTQACWYGNKVEDGSDIVMLDMRYPYWAESTYFAVWNMNVNLGGYFYAGVAGSTPKPEEEVTYKPGTVWSFWGDPSYKNRQVRNVYMNPVVYARQYVGEGASGSAGGRKVPWLAAKQWYTMTLRLWGTDTKNEECYVGQWMKDQTNNEWHHLATFKVPNASTGFKGNGGFLEDFGNAGRKQREIHHGKGFMRNNKEWKPCNEVSIDVPKYDGLNFQGWVVNAIEDGRVLTMAHSGNKELGQNLEPGKKHTFVINQPDKPTLDPLNATATGTILDDQLTVEWTLDKHSSPQLGYKVEVYDNSSYTGTPLLTKEEMVPQQRVVSLSLPKGKAYYPKVTLTDIFDQTLELPIKELAKGKALNTVEAETASGLVYTYVESDKPFASMKDVDFSKSTRTGVSRGLDITLRGRRGDKVAFQYEGFLNVPESGAYTFTLKSCDGSIFELDGQSIIENDGIHSSSEVSKTCFLKKGLVPVKMSFFKNDNDPEHTNLWLGWSYGNKATEAIAPEQFTRPVSEDIPTIALEGAASDGFAQIKPKTSAQKINKIEYFNGKKLVAIADKAPFEAKVPLLNGENHVWARLFYNDKSTIDSDHLVLNNKDTKSPDMTYTLIGEQGLKNGIQTKDGTYTFVGEGEYFVNKPVKGDFEITARVVDFQSSKQGADGDAWAGLMVMRKPEQSTEIGIMQTAGLGLRSSPPHSDLGYSRMSPYELPKDCPWLKVTRAGSLFTCYYSKDKQDWKVAFERYIPDMPEEVYAGLNFRAIPARGDVYFTGTMDSLEIKPATITPEAIKTPLAMGKIAGYTPISDDKAFVRSREGGVFLLKKNAQDQYKATKLILPKGVSFVRTILFNGKTMMILAPVGDSASVFVSRDGGKTWKENLKGLKLDPQSKDISEGDLLDFNPNTPTEWLVGSYKTGVFKSTDDGETWTESGLKDEPITDISYSPILKDYLTAISFDKEGKVSRLYESRDLGASWHKAIEMPNTGFLKIHFDARSTDKINILSTNGFLTTFTWGRDYIRLNQVVPADKTFIGCDNVRNDVCFYWLASDDGKSLYRSRSYTDGWTDCSEGIPDWGNVLAIKVNKEFRDNATVYGEKGIYATTDGGKTWKKQF